MPVVVIGMHRSGTSMLAGMLGIAGVSLGEESDLMPAAEWNQKGYWEHVRFVEFNERILARYGGSWLPPPPLPEGWLEDPEIRRIADEARAFIAANFDGGQCWGWKDPRTSLTVPFWRAIAPGLKFVYCVRNPWDVAESLRKRDGISRREGLAAWHYYNQVFLRDTSPEERILARYEDYFADYQRLFGEVLAFLGLPPIDPDSPRGQAISGFVDKGLQHHRHGRADIAADPDIPPQTLALYDAILAGSNDPEAVADAPISIALLEYLRLTIAAEDGDRRARGTRREHDRLAQVLADVIAHRDQISADLERTEARARRLNSRVEHLESILDARVHRVATRVGEWLQRVRS